MAQNPRILLVDDEAEILSLVASELRRSGFDVLEADSGRAGVEVLGDQDVDIVITDFFMSGMDGIKMLQAIQEKTGKSLPAILISGLFPPHVNKNGVNVVAMIEKPFLVDQLVDAIRQVTDSGSRSALSNL